jgi:hypothetical protein
LANVGHPSISSYIDSDPWKPHWYDPPQRFLDMYDWRKIELPKNFRDRMADKPRIYQRMRLQYWDQLSDDEVKQAIAHYTHCSPCRMSCLACS